MCLVHNRILSVIWFIDIKDAASIPAYLGVQGVPLAHVVMKNREVTLMRVPKLDCKIK